MAEEKLNKDTSEMKSLEKVLNDHSSSNLKSNISYEDYEALKRGFIEERKQLEDQMWLDLNLNHLDDIMRKHLDASVNKFSEKIIHFISRVTEAIYGAFFVADKEQQSLEAAAGYATTPDTMDRSVFKFGEGLIGQVAKTREMLLLDHIETQLDSSIGRVNASYLLVTPLIYDQNIYGIIEINTLNKLSPRYINFLKRASHNVAASLHTLLSNQKTKQLLNESLQQAEYFKAQKLALEKKEQELRNTQQKLLQKESELKSAMNNISPEALIDFEAKSQIEKHDLINRQQEELDNVRIQLEKTQEKLSVREAELAKLIKKNQEGDHKLSSNGQADLNMLPAEKYQALEQAYYKLKDRLEAKEDEIKSLLNHSASQVNGPATEPENTAGSVVNDEGLVKKIEQLDKDFQRKLKEIEMFKETIKWKDAEIDRQDESLIEKKREIRILNEHIQELKTENLKNLEEIVRQGKELKSKDTDLKNVQADFEQLSAQSDAPELTRQLEEKEKELADLRALLEQHKNDLVNVQEELAQKHQKALEEKDGLLAEIQENFKLQSQSYQELEQKINNSSQDLSDKENLLSSQKDHIRQLEEQIARHDAELKEAQAKLRKKEDELLVSQYLLNQKSETSADSDAVQKMRIELEEQKQLMHSREEEIEKLKAQVNQPTSGEVSSGLEEMMAQKNEEIQQLEAALKEKEVLEVKFNNLEQKLEETEKELGIAQEKIDVQASTSQDIVDNLKSLIHQKELQIEQVRSEVSENNNSDFTDIIQKLQAQIKSQEEEIELLQSKANTSQEPLPESEAIRQLQGDLERIKQELEQKKQNNLLQVEALDSLKSELSQKNQLIKDLEEGGATPTESAGNPDSEEMEKLIQELRQKEDEIVQQAEALNHLRTQLLEKEKTLDSLKARLVEKSDSPDNQEENFFQKLTELENIESNLSEKEKAILDKSQVIEGHHKELEELRDVLKVKEDENARQAEKIQSQQQQLLIKQKEMNQKEKELASLFNKINTAFAAMEFDMDGNVLSINNKFLMLLGLKVEDVEGNKYENLISPDYAESTKYKILWQGLKMGASQNVENLVCIGNKGKEIQMNVTYIPIIGEEGRPYEVVKLVNNIIKAEENLPAPSTEEPKVEVPVISESSMEDREKLRALNNSFIIMELDLKGNIEMVNKQFLTFLGYEEKDVIGQHHRQFIDITERSTDTYTTIVKGFEQGGFSTEILKYVGKEGERMRLRSYFNPILDVHQNPQKVLVISQLVN